jgi:hypothetical protein
MPAVHLLGRQDGSLNPEVGVQPGKQKDSVMKKRKSKSIPF